MTDSYTLVQDFRSIVEIQKAFGILEPLLKEKNEVAYALSDVWNALIDARSCLLRKILESDLMTAVSFQDTLKDILKEGESHVQ